MAKRKNNRRTPDIMSEVKIKPVKPVDETEEETTEQAKKKIPFGKILIGLGLAGIGYAIGRSTKDGSDDDEDFEDFEDNDDEDDGEETETE